MKKMIELKRIADLTGKATILAVGAGLIGTAMWLYTGFILLGVVGGIK